MTVSSTSFARLNFSRAVLSAGIKSAGNDLFSGVSTNKVMNPLVSASWDILVSNTVFPTPRNPTHKNPREDSPFRHRSSAMLTFSIMSLLPASSGGIVPAPGA